MFPALAGEFFTHWATWEAKSLKAILYIAKCENFPVDTTGEGDSRMTQESSTDIHTLPCVTQTAGGNSP